MRVHLCYPALGLALIAGAPSANAQTVITREIADQPVETIIQQLAPAVVAQQPLVTVPAATVAQPAPTVQITETIRTVRTAPSRRARRDIVTTRTITRRVVPAPTVVARTVTTAPQPLYDVVAPAPIATAPQPLYDQVVAAPASVVAAPVVAAGSVVATAPVIYRYVYQPDRILVVDPTTGIAVQAIPR